MYLVVLGLQWGDEGKGKIVDVLASEAKAQVRFAGGPNAGHRVVKKGVKYDFHLLPSGILNTHTTVAIGNNVVIDIEQLFSEIDMVEARDISVKNRFFIAERAHIILSSYREEDKISESKRHFPIGTTGRGIGAAYAHKANRTGIRIIDMFSKHITKEFNATTKEFIKKHAERIEPFVVNMNEYIDRYESENVLLEGAQGVLLDIDMGTYPFVTSTNTGIHGALVGVGCGLTTDLKGIGVLKMYSTRVGHGPFPTELQENDTDLLEHIRETGFEYGITTGRPRRCGYLDLVAIKYACRINNVTSLALTHVDVYDKLDRIAFCTAYKHNGKHISHFPASLDVLEETDYELEYFDGWKEDITGMRNYAQLPDKLKSCIAFLEDYIGASIDIISVGPDNQQTIIRNNPWAAV